METTRKEVRKMQTVYLNGGIEKFGSKWEANCSNIRDVFRLIECQTPGFREYLVNAAENNVSFEIQRGSEFLGSPEELLLSLNEEDIIITEVPSGSKSGAAKLLAALAIASLFFIPGTQGLLMNKVGYSTTVNAGTAGASTVSGSAYVGLSTPGLIAASIATNLAITGISQMMMPGPEVDQGTDEAYLFDGPTNSITQGLPVPVAYGELIVGGAPISQYYRGYGWSGDGNFPPGKVINTFIGDFFIPADTLDLDGIDEAETYHG